MDERIIILKKPDLVEPWMVAAWPGMGLVGLRAVEFLRDRLGAQLFASIDPAGMFSVSGVNVKGGIAQDFRLPRSYFFSWKNEGQGPDLILFLGEAQPSSGHEYAMARLVMDVGMKFGVTRVYTAAAMATAIDHHAPSSVWGACSRLEHLPELRSLQVKLIEDGQIGGLNGVLIGLAREMKLQGTCLMGEIPYYTTGIENPRGSRSVLEVLCTVAGLQVPLHDLEARAQVVEQQIDASLSEAQKKVQEQATAVDDEEETAGGEEPGGEDGGGYSGSIN